MTTMIRRRSMLAGMAAAGAALASTALSAGSASAAEVCGVYTNTRPLSTPTHVWFEVYTRVLTTADIGHDVAIRVDTDGKAQFDKPTVGLMRQTGPSTWSHQDQNAYKSGIFETGALYVVTVTADMVGYCMLLNGYVMPYNGGTSSVLTAFSTINGSRSSNATCTVQFGSATPAGPVAPAAASAAGFTTLGFSDDFDSLSSIDLSHTGNAGFKWYPNKVNAFGTPNTDASVFSIANSVLTINPNVNNYNYQCGTADSTTGNGFTMKYGYAEARIKTNGVVPQGNVMSWGAFWSRDLDSMMGNFSTPGAELDFFEACGGPNSTTATTHLWDVDGVGKGTYRTPGGDGVFNTGSPIGNAFHTYGTLWEPGHVAYYFDGTKFFEFNYGAGWDYTQLPGENGTPGYAPAGSLSILDKQASRKGMNILLGSGTGNPMQLDWVRCWTK